jgi:hypothetical protein
MALEHFTQLAPPVHAKDGAIVDLATAYPGSHHFTDGRIPAVRFDEFGEE